MERQKIESFELIRAWDILQSTLQRAQALLVLRDVSRIMRKSSPRICDLPKEPPAAQRPQRQEGRREGGRLHTAETGDITTVQKVLQRLHEGGRERGKEDRGRGRVGQTLRRRFWLEEMVSTQH